jgi:RimJ/RimL family protein N-acetyltransferase
MENFDFTTDYILENDAVLLRPLQADDVQNLLPFSINEPDIWQYSLVTAAGEENLKQYITTALTAKTNKIEYPFIVFDKKQNSYAGLTRFYDIQLANKTLQLGYTWYGKAFQGPGLNKNCKLLLLEFAFEQMQMERVEFRADNNNAKSIAAMKSIGCVVEGVLRQNVPKQISGRRDSIVLSILKSEWENGVKENLQNRVK